MTNATFLYVRFIQYKKNLNKLNLDFKTEQK